jgi:hypothetical protein
MGLAARSGGHRSLMGEDRIENAGSDSPGGEQDRFDELIEKRVGPGLSREEADELGRLFAEREGKPYGNADDPPAEVEEERHGGDGETTPS